MTNKYLVFDVETTGIDTDNDRIVQLYIATADEEGDTTDAWEWIINPGVDVPKAASDVHGLTTEYLLENGDSPEVALREAEVVFKGAANDGLVFVAFNANFDISILTSEFWRHLCEPLWGNDLYENQRIFDPIVVDRAKDKYRKGKRTLEALAKHYGIPFNDDLAHDAGYDVEVTAKVAAAVVGKFGIPSNAEQAAMHKRWAEGLTEYFAKIGKTEDNGRPIVVESSWPVRINNKEENK